MARRYRVGLSRAGKNNAALGGALTALAPDCNYIEDGGVKSPRLFLFAVALPLLFTSFARAEEQSDWLHAYNKAQELAKAKHKLLLLNFTASDWCGWWIKFEKETLSQPQFNNYAHVNPVSVKPDFP